MVLLMGDMTQMYSNIIEALLYNNTYNKFSKKINLKYD
jgi:hypothetical protein